MYFFLLPFDREFGLCLWWRQWRLIFVVTAEVSGIILFLLVHVILILFQLSLFFLLKIWFVHTSWRTMDAKAKPKK